MLNVYFRLDVVIPAGTECLFRRLDRLFCLRARLALNRVCGTEHSSLFSTGLYYKERKIARILKIQIL